MKFQGLIKKLGFLPSLILVATASAFAAGPAAVYLGSAGNFAILTKSGITDVPTSVVTGNVGTSPISGSFDGLTCPEVSGLVYSVDAAGPAPCNIADPSLLTSAVNDMQTAYTYAAGVPLPTATDLGAGSIGGMTLAPGLYKWGTGVLISTDLTLKGGSSDVWIFQIAQNLTLSNGISVHLSGGALARNIFWQVGGGTGVALGTTSHMQGTILAIKAITMGTGATINGRLLAQSDVTLQSNVVTLAGAPAPTLGTSYIFPSPARGNTAAIAYLMPSPGTVHIRIYNEVGTLVDTIEESKPAGQQTSNVSIGRLAPGVYAYLLSINFNSGATQHNAVNKFVVSR